MSKEHINSRILFISDMHIPYHHRDTLDFLKAVKSKYEPTRIICVGDELDYHSISFHDSDPDLAGAGDELELAINSLQPFYKLFPKVDVIESNHGSLPYRKGKFHNLPKKLFKDYAEIIEAPPGWEWHSELHLILPDKNEVLVTHGTCAAIENLVTARGMCAVQGHYHTRFKIEYVSTPDKLLWGLQVGCSIDSGSPAFEYDRKNLKRPVKGHGIVIDSHPKLLPMPLSKSGRWNKVVP